MIKVETLPQADFTAMFRAYAGAAIASGDEPDEAAQKAQLMISLEIDAINSHEHGMILHECAYLIEWARGKIESGNAKGCIFRHHGDRVQADINEGQLSLKCADRLILADTLAIESLLGNQGFTCGAVNSDPSWKFIEFYCDDVHQSSEVAA